MECQPTTGTDVGVEMTRLTHQAAMEAIWVARMVLNQYQLYYEQLFSDGNLMIEPSLLQATIEFLRQTRDLQVSGPCRLHEK